MGKSAKRRAFPVPDGPFPRPSAAGLPIRRGPVYPMRRLASKPRGGASEAGVCPQDEPQKNEGARCAPSPFANRETQGLGQEEIAIGDGLSIARCARYARVAEAPSSAGRVQLWHARRKLAALPVALTSVRRDNHRETHSCFAGVGAEVCTWRCRASRPARIHYGGPLADSSPGEVIVQNAIGRAAYKVSAAGTGLALERGIRGPNAVGALEGGEGPTGRWGAPALASPGLPRVWPALLRCARTFATTRPARPSPGLALPGHQLPSGDPSCLSTNLVFRT